MRYMPERDIPNQGACNVAASDQLEAEVAAIDLGAFGPDETRNSGEIDRELLVRSEAEVVLGRTRCVATPLISPGFGEIRWCVSWSRC